MTKSLLTYQDILNDPEIPTSSITTVKRWIQRGDFPAPAAFGPRMKRWNREIIEAWKADHRAAQAAA